MVFSFSNIYSIILLTPKPLWAYIGNETHKNDEEKSDDESIEMKLSERGQGLPVIDEQSLKTFNKISNWKIKGKFETQ